MRNDCTQALARIKSKSEPVKGAERLRIARGLLSPLSPFDFDWDNLSQSSAFLFPLRSRGFR